MNKQNSSRANFSGKLGYVLATAGSAVGLGNIWRFPYLAAKYGGGIFILAYVILAVTFGYTMMISETTLGRMTRQSASGAYRQFSSSRGFRLGGLLNAVVPMIIVGYYCVIGGWVLRYLIAYVAEGTAAVAENGYFSNFITSPSSSELCFLLFAGMTALLIILGVESGIERGTKVMMPILVVLALVIAVYSMTRPGAMAGVKYIFIPDFSHFTWMAVVAAMEQMFYSLSIAMGILFTYGSYMKQDVDIEKSTYQVQIFDTGIALLAALMVIPAVFAFSGGDPEQLKAGPSLIFITLPKVFDSMGAGRPLGALFFLLVLFAALTSSISLMEAGVSSFVDELKCKRGTACFLMCSIILVFGSLSSLGYNVLSSVTIIGMQFLDFFDFLTNAVMMPIAALATCLLIVKAAGIDALVKEIHISSRFKSEGLYRVCIRYIAPIALLIIFVSSILSAFGLLNL